MFKTKESISLPPKLPENKESIRSTGQFLSEEVKEIVEKIQRNQEENEKGIENRNSLPKTRHTEPTLPFKPAVPIESIPEDNEDENIHSSNDFRERNSTHKTSNEDDHTKKKVPNVFISSLQTKEPIDIYDYEKMALENSNVISEIPKGSEIDNEGSQLVNIYSERNLSSYIDSKDLQREPPQQKMSLTNNIKKVVNYEDLEEEKLAENMKKIYQIEGNQIEKEENIGSPSHMFPGIQDCSPIDSGEKVQMNGVTKEKIGKKLHFQAAARVADAMTSDERRTMKHEREILSKEILEMEREIKELQEYKTMAIDNFQKILYQASNGKKEKKTKVKKREVEFSSPPKPSKYKANENPETDSVYSQSKGYTSIYSIKKDYANSPSKYFSPTKVNFSKAKESLNERISEAPHYFIEENSKILKIMTTVEREIMNSIKKRQKKFKH